MNVVYTGAFRNMFSALLNGRLAENEVGAAVRKKLCSAYAGLLDVTTTTTKEYFEFIVAGASCFDPVCFPGAGDTRTFEERLSCVSSQLCAAMNAK